MFSRNRAQEYSTLFQAGSLPFTLYGASLEHQTPMAKTEPIVLQSSLGIDECLKRIQDSADPGKRTLFSLSGYKGSKPLLVRFEGNQFRLWKRRYYRNDFSPYFYGVFRPIIMAHASKDISTWTVG